MGNKGEFRGVFARELKMLLDGKHSCGIKYTDEELYSSGLRISEALF